MKSPFILKDKTNVLTQYCDRTGKTAEIAELRYTMNGWRSQCLMHNVADITDFTVSDVENQCKEKGVRPKSPLAVAVAECIKNSKPLFAVYNFRDSDWSLSLTPRKVNGSLFDIGGVRNEVNDMHFIGIGKGLADSLPFTTYCRGLPNQQMEGTKLQTSAIPTWSGIAESDAAEMFTKLGKKMTSDDKRRLTDPQGWWKDVLAKHGFPVENFGQPELFHFTKQNHVGNNPVKLMQHFSVKGLTSIFSFPDTEGRVLRLVGPQIDGNLAIAPSLSWGEGDAKYCKPQWYVQSAMNKEAELLPDSVNAALQASAKINTSDYIFNFGYGSKMDAPIVIKATDPMETTPKNWSRPSPIESMPALGNDYQAYVDDEGVTHDDILIHKKWKMATPAGFIDVFSPNAKVTVASVSDHFPNVYSIESDILGIRTTMEPVRNFLRKQAADPNATPTDKRAANDALKQSENYADAILSMTVYAGALPFPSKEDVDGLQLVRDAKKGDMDIYSESLGNDMTLGKAAKFCNAQRKKGQKASAFVNVVDEAAAVADLCSPYVAARSIGSLWVLSGTQDAIDGSWSLKGKYINETEVSLTDMEGALLRARGAQYAKGTTLTDKAFIEDMDYGEGFINELGTIDIASLEGQSASIYWGSASVKKYGLGPQEFISLQGYPVVKFPDKDSMVRAVLSYKGFGDDPSSMLLTMFFANQLDLQ